MPITRFIGALLRGLCTLIGLVRIILGIGMLLFPGLILLDIAYQRPPLESVRQVLGGSVKDLFKNGNTAD